MRGLTGHTSPDLLVGLDDGDDAAVVRIDDGTAVVATADFFTPVVDDAYDWGRIAAANALSDVYAMGGRPVVAVNLVGWPRACCRPSCSPRSCAAATTSRARRGCFVAGGHSIDDPEPKYGMAVTGLVDPDRLLRNDARRGRPAAHPDQAARRRGAQQPAQGHRRGLRRTRSPAWWRLNRDAAAAAVAAGRAGRHRRDRVRPAGSPAQDDARERRRRRSSTRLPSPTSRARARPCATASSAAAPGATSTGSVPTCRRPSTRTSCCCWPTRRPAVVCSWSARCRAARSSARSSPDASTASRCADATVATGAAGPLGRGDTGSMRPARQR